MDFSGRERVACLLAKLVVRRKVPLDEKAVEKIFFLVANRLLNETYPPALSWLTMVIQDLLRQDLVSKSNGVKKYIMDWAAKKDSKVAQLMSVSLAAIASEMTLSPAQKLSWEVFVLCESIFDDFTAASCKDHFSVVVKSKLMAIANRLVDSESEHVTDDDLVSRVPAFCNHLLHPSLDVRKACVALFSNLLPRLTATECLIESSVLARIVSNFHELAKKTPGDDCLPALTSLALIPERKGDIMHRMINLFNYERVTLPATFTRRQLVLDWMTGLAKRKDYLTEDDAVKLLKLAAMPQNMTKNQELRPEPLMSALKPILGAMKYEEIVRSVNNHGIGGLKRKRREFTDRKPSSRKVMKK